jgi:DNA segregation ATPase FtsK/SpoIIIE-like protein
MAKEWLSDREERTLPDLIGLRLNPETDEAVVDIVEVKTYSNSENAFKIEGNEIWGHAVEQASVLESLAKEIFGATEKITTVSRREILREQVFEALFQSNMSNENKLRYSEMLNALFAGEYSVEINKSIAFVDFENAESSAKIYTGRDAFAGKKYCLDTIGSDEIRAIISNLDFTPQVISEATENSSQATEQSGASQTTDTELAITNNVEVSDSIQSNEVLSQADSSSTTEAQDRRYDSVSSANDVIIDNDIRKAIEEKCIKLNKVFRDYGINAHPINPEMVQEAARFTRFPVELKSGETVRSLERYKTDIGIQLEANGEILINHIKGTKYISVDVPFAHSGKAISLLEHLNLTSSKEGALNIVAGQKADGKFEIMDISKAPHMLIAGTTGSGKTIFLHSILVSLLNQYSADELEVLIIDPKQTDFIFFEGIPHLYGGHVVIDAEEALEKIQQINTVDKEERTAALRSCRSKDIESYNQKNPEAKMKRLVVVIDEYSDLIQAAEMQGNRKEFEKNLLMLLQRVRNLGIHLIIATQRPSAQIVTGALKAVIPFRVSFRLPSHTDSQTILDMSGAENLLGKGDMLMVTDSDTMRMQGLYISEDELSDFIEKI